MKEIKFNIPKIEASLDYVVKIKQGSSCQAAADLCESKLWDVIKITLLGAAENSNESLRHQMAHIMLDFWIAGFLMGWKDGKSGIMKDLNKVMGN